MILLTTFALFAIVAHAAHPTGTFTLDYVNGNLTSSLRECDSQLYSTAGVPGNKGFDFDLINAMNGDRNSVSIRSGRNKSMYVQVVNGKGVEPNRLGIDLFNSSDLNAVSFEVVGGLNNPTMFSFKAFTGQFIALTHELKGDCASKFKAPDSDIALVALSDLKDKASATWRLMVPTK